MAELHLHGRQIDSVFELLGSNENDITFSLGWALAHGPSLATAVLRLQERGDQPGITDIEILGPEVHAIVEAKRGWQVPTRRQLAMYTPRLQALGRLRQVMISMSEATREYASRHLPRNIDGIPVVHLSWREIMRMTSERRGSHVEKRLLEELRKYLAGIVSVQNQQSNMVYVVSLGSGTPEWSSTSWIDFVEQERCYFHPFKSGWPKEPPNYIGVRYKGRLQSIHHIESWKLVDSLAGVPGVDPRRGPERPFLLYVLGPPIVPPVRIPTGDRIRQAARVWAALDLLLTCDTITEAMLETKRRLNGDEPG